MNRRIDPMLMALAVIATLSLGCSQVFSRADAERNARDSVYDASITMRIKTTYLFNGHLNPFRINVDTRDGIVTLHGTVPSDIHRDLAGAIARSAEGVRDVENELKLSSASDPGPNEVDSVFGEAVQDASTTAAIKMSLALELGLPATHIGVHTERGTVTLMGEAGSQTERQIAARIARGTTGVKHVVNQLEIRG